MTVEPLRVALLAADLRKGGAEKQLVYVARALVEAGVTMRVYTLTQGEEHEATLRALGLEPIWFGRRGNPLLRLGTLASALREFRPQLIQSMHSFANLYASLLGRWFRAVSVGALRSSVEHSRQGNGAWTPWLIRTPTALIVNSEVVRDDLLERRLRRPEGLFLLPNVIELADYDQEQPRAMGRQEPSRLTAILVGRLVGLKRVDRFLRAVGLAASEEPAVRGVVVGDGPERANLEQLAGELGLGPERVRFVGQRQDVPRLLGEADVLVHCSGDAKFLVQDGANGYVVPFDDPRAMAERLVRLAREPELRSTMGHEGRKRVEREYSFDRLAERLLAIYEVLLARN
jgi:glycosyltransferase involved in cell wall biosynthesis